MREFKVYLSGPISGLNWNDAVGWTDYAKSELAYIDDDESIYQTTIIGYKPLRGKEFLKDQTDLDAKGYTMNPMATPRGIFKRDKYDVTSCDAMLVNLLGAKRVSIGTMFEMAWAEDHGKPIVLVIEDEGNFHEHCFVTESICYRTNDLDHGIQLIKNILLP